MFDHIYLEEESKSLFITLVEAHRNVPKNERCKFRIYQFAGDPLPHIQHPGLPAKKVEAFSGDIENLHYLGLISLTDQNRSSEFHIMPVGFQYYQYLKSRIQETTERISSNVRAYLEAEYFQKRFVKAYRKWSQAEDLLWQADSDSQLTTIGHLCREAMQEFATTLVEEFNPPGVTEDKAKTIARIKAVISLNKPELSERIEAFLDALIHYWGTINDLVQRQEHGGQKVGKDLIWEDGRRVVFHTAITMMEISQSLTLS